MTPYPRGFVRAARRLVRTPVGDAIARRLYPRAAKLAAAVLGRVDGVAAVYVGGSLRRLDAITPGYSDLDLMLFTHPFATDAAHVRFRDAVDDRLRALHLAFPAIQTVDYLDAGSIPLVRAAANDFGRTIDSRFVHAYGARLLDPARHTAARDRSLEYVFAVRRWSKAAATLLADDAFGDPFERLRSTRRLFTDIASGYAGTERLATFAETLVAVLQCPLGRRQRAALDAVASVPQANGQAFVPVLLAGTLAVLEAFADECTRGFDARSEDSADAASPPDEVRLHTDAVALGAERAVIIDSLARSRSAQGFITFDDALDISAVISRAGAIAARCRTYTEGEVHPVFLTPSLVRAAFALDPIPLVGPLLSARTGSGAVVPPTIERTLHVARVVSGLWRVPSMRFHEMRGHDARVSAARELSLLFHLVDVLDGAARSDEISPLAVRDEHDLVAALRAYAARVHEAVPRALARDAEGRRP